MAKLLMFASMREAAGTGRADVDGKTVAEVLNNASARFGEQFDRILPYCMVLLDEERTDDAAPVTAQTEVALLPPVSGGAL